MKRFTQDEVREYWATGKPFIYNGITYDVGKMSYGQYFIEPSREGRTENDPFDKDTLWFVRIDDKTTDLTLKRI